MDVPVISPVSNNNIFTVPLVAMLGYSPYHVVYNALASSDAVNAFAPSFPFNITVNIAEDQVSVHSWGMWWCYGWCLMTLTWEPSRW